MPRELLRERFVPILVGNDTLPLARRLFTHYGLISHLLTAHPPLRRYLCPWVRCHALPERLSDDVFLLALTDLAEELATEDRTPLLIPCSIDSRLLDDNIRQALESQMILCREDELDELVAFKGGLTL